LQNKKVSILLIALLIFSLLMPTAGFTAPAANGKSFTSQLRNIEYKFSDKYLNQKIERERTPALEEQAKQKQREGTAHTAKIEQNNRANQNDSVQEKKSLVEAKNYVPVSDSKENISVIVELQEEPVAAHEAKVKQGLLKAGADQKLVIQREQRSFKAAAEQQLKVKIEKTYSYVFNGFALEIAADKVEQLLNLPGVKAVYPDSQVVATAIEKLDVQPMMDRSAPHIGANQLWEMGITGSGIKVGVIDTGIDYFHPDLADAYKGGYDFVANDNDPYETTPGERPPNLPEYDQNGNSYWTEHGTHVSGIVAGRGVSANGVKGVAPGADIYAYRVLGPYGTGTNSNVIAGIERAVLDGMDVINLSLGSSSNNQNSPDSIALNNAMLAGVVVSVSNGNSGPNDGTVTDPASSEMAISVGNSTPPIEAPALTVDGLSTVTGAMLEFSPDLGNLAGQTLEVVDVGLGRPADFNGKDVNGKIALISRGEIPFKDKSLNAKNAGAAVAVIYNNAPGNFSGTLGEPGDYIPTFSLSQEDGLRLKNKLDTDGSLFAQLGTVLEQDYINDSSSRGPARPGFDIKPDIAAPGTGIRSSVPAYGKEDPGADYGNAYAAFTGTSMAAPHIAGSAALFLSHYANLTPFEIKSLLMNNAKKIADRNNQRYSHMAQGAGRVDLVNSIHAKAVALVEEYTNAVRGGQSTQYYTGSLSFGSVPAGSSDVRTIRVKDIVGENSSYSVTTLWYGDEGGNLSTSANQISVDANGFSQFTLTLNIPADKAEGRYEGELILTEAGGHILQLPINVYVGTPAADEPVTNLQIDSDIFSPNEDGVNDTADVTFDLNAPAGYISLDAHDWDGNWLGPLVEAENMPPGSYIVRDWDGVILFWNMFPYLLEDDIYLMVPWYGEDIDNIDYVESQITPFIVDTVAPESSLNDPDIEVDPVNRTGVISGTINSDMLIDLIHEEILLNPISELFGAGVLYEENGEWVQVDGTVNDDGSFAIEVPLKPGENQFEVYVYDAAGNGLVQPAHIVNYTFDAPAANVNIAAHPSKDQVNVEEPFTVGIDFSQAEDLYAAQFSLTYDAGLTKGSVTPSDELAAYQAEHNPNAGLIVNEKVVDLGNGKVRSDYLLTLAGDFAGYDGTGALATFNFASQTAGDFNFELSNVRLLDSNGEDIELGEITSGTVRVTSGGGPDPGDDYVITGTITAEAFGEGVDYSETWYEGADGVHKVVVEALDAEGHVAKIGTVNADGSYRLSVRAGNYTIRVVVPGHFGAAESVVADANKSVNFGPLTAGDVNGDGVIDLKDLQQAAKAFGKAAPWSDARSSAADINRDSTVDLLDISFILNNYGLQR